MESRTRNLVAIERMQIFRQVVDEISSYIDENQLQPGDRLPADRALVSALKVSRPLVQQALKVLEGLGRVTIVHGLGTFVADNGHQVAAAELIRGAGDPQTLKGDLLQVRDLVDSEALRLAFATNKAALLDHLAAIMHDRESELADEAVEASLMLRFEAAFGQFCGNEVLRRVQMMLHHAWLESQIGSDNPLPDRFVLHSEHEGILRALVDGDLPQALILLDRHVHNLNS